METEQIKSIVELAPIVEKNVTSTGLTILAFGSLLFSTIKIIKNFIEKIFDKHMQNNNFLEQEIKLILKDIVSKINNLNTEDIKEVLIHIKDIKTIITQKETKKK